MSFSILPAPSRLSALEAFQTPPPCFTRLGHLERFHNGTVARSGRNKGQINRWQAVCSLTVQNGYRLFLSAQTTRLARGNRSALPVASPPGKGGNPPVDPPKKRSDSG